MPNSNAASVTNRLHSPNPKQRARKVGRFPVFSSILRLTPAPTVTRIRMRSMDRGSIFARHAMSRQNGKPCASSIIHAPHSSSMENIRISVTRSPASGATNLPVRVAARAPFLCFQAPHRNALVAIQRKTNTAGSSTARGTRRVIVQPATSPPAGIPRISIITIPAFRSMLRIAM
jgi:hypothetical protein